MGAAAALLALLAGLAPMGMPALDPARPGWVPTPPSYVRKATWQATLTATRACLSARRYPVPGDDAGALWARLDRDFPVPSDWMLQDAGLGRDGWFEATPPVGLMRDATLRACAELGRAAAPFRARLAALEAARAAADDARRLDLYVAACHARRARRLGPLLRKAPRIVFAKHFNMGGSHYAYTDGQSDAQNERHFYPGSALCRLDMQGLTGRVTTLVDDPGGVIRDPNVHWDGRKVAFAWKRSELEDDYHLYDIDAFGGKPRQLTRGLGFADYEPAYLPNGDLVFSSTRCVQTVDCWWTEVANLYSCAPDGSRIRRLGFDQVHTNYPQALDDGTVTYTRWEYNDRGQLFVQSLFQMRPDGSGQTERYGNNSWFPTSLLHARGVPGSGEVMAVASGHHSSQAGKLCVVDTRLGSQENQGVRLVAPRRATPAERIDAYGQMGDQWMYPYPLSDRELIVSFWPDDGHRTGRSTFDGHYSIFWMDVDGRRELLASDPERSCHNPSPLMPRKAPASTPRPVVEPPAMGSYYVQDVYAGPAMAGVARGSAASLRVVALDYRAAGVRANGNSGPAGGALVSTPIAIGNGAWDPKVVLGEAAIQPDGSAYFTAPARTPLYFQVLDGAGKVIQTMRSWSTLQPGERASCTGCHEPKSAAPAASRTTQALRAGPQPLVTPGGAGGGYSFRRRVQPILDKHCVGCHRDPALRPPGAPSAPHADLTRAAALSPEGALWRWTTERPAEGWERPGFDDTRWPEAPAAFGNTGFGVRTPWQAEEIWLRRTFTLAAPPAGRELLLNVFHDEDVEVSLNGVPAAEAQGFVVAMKQMPVSAAAARALHAGVNTLAVHCRQTAGGQGVEVGLYALDPPAGAAPGPHRAFSLLGTPRPDVTAGRLWSEAYLALTAAAPDQRNADLAGAWLGRSSRLVNWVSPQSTPPIQPAYAAGSARSDLMKLLEHGHGGTRLTAAELREIACWIDLAVPFCGDYIEANCWTPEETDKYLRFLAKRLAMEEVERRGRMKPTPGAARSVRIEFIGADDAGLVRTSAVGSLTLPRELRVGDRALLCGPPAMRIRLGGGSPEAEVRTADGIRIVELCPPGAARPQPAGRMTITARPADGR